MKLRPYQEEAIQAIKRYLNQGNNKQVIVLATGLGKTVIFGHLIADIVKATGKKALVIAHREELLTQARDKILAVNPALKIGIEMADQKAEANGDVVVASVQTIGRANSQRKSKFDPKNFSIVVVDEAHHASASTYREVLRYFGLDKQNSQYDWNRDCLLLGVTATPQRNDENGIDTVFNKTTYEFGIIQGIQQGWLSRIKAFRVNTHTDLSGIGNTAGDFKIGELADRINNEDRNGLIVSAYKRLTPGKQALCFAANVSHTMELAKRFNEEGVSADYVLGATDKDERKQKLKDFYDGKIQVMVNAMVLTEGYDNEYIETVLMARPTQSGILFQQMIGRGTRLSENKECLTVIDFVDNTSRQRLQTVSSLIGIPGTVDFKGQDILEAKEKIDNLLELAPNFNLSKLDLDKIKYAIEEVDLMSGLKIPEEIEAFTKFQWHRYGEDHYRIALLNDRYIAVKKTLTGQWAVEGSVWDNVKGVYTVKQADTQYQTLDQAIEVVDKHITKKFPDQVTLVNSESKWRKQPPSEKQIEYLRKAFRVSPIVLDQLDKGQASSLLSKLKSTKQRGWA